MKTDCHCSKWRSKQGYDPAADQAQQIKQHYQIQVNNNNIVLLYIYNSYKRSYLPRLRYTLAVNTYQTAVQMLAIAKSSRS